MIRHAVRSMCLLLALALPAAGCAGVRVSIDAGGGLAPLWESESDLPGDIVEHRWFFGLAREREAPTGERSFVIQPLLERRLAQDGKKHQSFVLPPLAIYGDEDPIETSSVWPFYTSTRFGTDEQRATGQSDDDTAILPFLLWGDEPAQGPYFCFFPFYGTLKGKLLADEIDIVAFPLYLRTKSGDWKSKHVLWPLIAWGEGEGRSHFRVMPLWSQTDSRTGRRRTALWPLLHASTEERGDRVIDAWMVFPLFGRGASRDGAFLQWSALFPFFQFSRDERTGDRSDGILWPIYRDEYYPGAAERFWLWPFYGEFRTLHDPEDLTARPAEETRFILWPFYLEKDIREGDFQHRLRYLIPLWMQTQSEPVGGGPRDEALISWPLFSWSRKPDGRELMRFPGVIPLFRWDTGQNIYGDLLSLVRYERDREGRARWDAPLGIARWRCSLDGAERLRLLWWLSISWGGDE